MYRLQPLDISCFQPLAIYYQVELDNYIQQQQGQTSFTKRSFYPLFRLVWQKAFNSYNILSGFLKTGIYPFNPNIVLNSLTLDRPTTPNKANIQLKLLPTPTTSQSIYRIQKLYKADPSPVHLNLILQSQIQLCIQYKIDIHIHTGLQLALKTKKERRKRRKRLNLIGEKDSGPQLFTAAKVQKALALRKEKEEEQA